MKETYLRSVGAVKLTGYFCLFQKEIEQPHIITLPENSAIWITVFSSVDKLEEFCADAKITEYKIKQITDGRDFVQSLAEQGVRVMLDPFAMRSENKTRWTEVITSQQ